MSYYIKDKYMSIEQQKNYTKLQGLRLKPESKVNTKKHLHNWFDNCSPKKIHGSRPDSSRPYP